eukprot:Clim_evm25s229 gene=Clim_evmTU25s229
MPGPGEALDEAQHGSYPVRKDESNGIEQQLAQEPMDTQGPPEWLETLMEIGIEAQHFPRALSSHYYSYDNVESILAAEEQVTIYFEKDAPGLAILKGQGLGLNLEEEERRAAAAAENAQANGEDTDGVNFLPLTTMPAHSAVDVPFWLAEVFVREGLAGFRPNKAYAVSVMQSIGTSPAASTPLPIDHYYGLGIGLASVGLSAATAKINSRTEDMPVELYQRRVKKSEDIIDWLLRVFQHRFTHLMSLAMSLRDDEDLVKAMEGLDMQERSMFLAGRHGVLDKRRHLMD